MNPPAEIRHTLRADPILQAVVGEDEDHEVKVYTPIAKSNVLAPYVTLQVIPSLEPIRVYGDDEAILVVNVALGCWGRTQTESWQVAEVADEALKRGDYSFEPYGIMHVLRTSLPVELQDRDTSEFYITTQYQFALSR